jgi:putative Mg2+ transporter-C (MgtC) family protein
MLNFNFDQLVVGVAQLALAFVLPMLTAYDREASSRSAGLRTFPLVSMAACAFTLLAVTMFEQGGGQARIVQGIITGIGFIGGGAILKNSSDVSGLSTAAAIWSTGAVGVAVGMQRLEIAVALSVMTYIVFKLLGPVKEQVEEQENADN